MSSLVIRAASMCEFATAIEWAAREGWNPGCDDLQAFHQTDPDGCLMGWIDDVPVSSISVIRYGRSFGFLGFYIVHPDHRGTGAGIATWNAGMARLEGRTVGLDGVPDQLQNYARSGFDYAGRNIRFTGLANAAVSAYDGLDVRDCRVSDMADVMAYDKPFFAAPRDQFIRPWIDPEMCSTRRTKLALKDHQVAGYGTVRECRSGYKIGPLFCDDAHIANALFSSLCAELPEGAQVSLDVPEDNSQAVNLARINTLAPAFETARMYRGGAPDLPVDRTFGITTFELG